MGEILDLICGHVVELDVGDDHSEGARGTELELVNGEVIGAEVGAVAIKELSLEECEGEEPLEVVENLSLYQHTLGVWSDLDIANLKLVTDIKKFPLSGGILRKGVSAGPPEIAGQGRMISPEKDAEYQDEEDLH